MDQAIRRKKAAPDAIEMKRVARLPVNLPRASIGARELAMKQLALRLLALSAPLVLLGAAPATAHTSSCAVSLECLTHRVLLNQRGEARLSLVAQAADVPMLDTKPTCAGAASIGMVDRTAADCQRSEQEARDELKSKWTQFPRSDQRNCIAETKIGGFPSYVQVLACLEIARDAKNLRADGTPEPMQALQDE